MLSKKEREYLEGNLHVSKNYENKLLFSIRTKLRSYLDSDLPLLQKGLVRGIPLLGNLTVYQTKLTPRAQNCSFPSKNDSSLTEFSNEITKNSNHLAQIPHDPSYRKWQICYVLHPTLKIGKFRVR